MASRAAEVVVRTEHGRVTVLAYGRTGRGVKYIKGTKTLAVPSMADRNFKGQMASAVEELVGSEAVDIQYGMSIDNPGG